MGAGWHHLQLSQRAMLLVPSSAPCRSKCGIQSYLKIALSGLPSACVPCCSSSPFLHAVESAAVLFFLA